MYLWYHLIYTDMGVHHYGFEDVFSMYWAVHRFFHKVDINSALIRIAYNHCYLHPQMLNLMMLWYFLILFELLQMFVGFAAVNIADYYLSVWNAKWIKLVTSIIKPNYDKHQKSLFILPVHKTAVVAMVVKISMFRALYSFVGNFDLVVENRL